MNSTLGTFLTILFAPLIGVLCFFLLNGLFLSLEWVSLFYVLAGWIVAFAITATIGVPLGLGVSHLLLRGGLESRSMYALAGLALAASLPAAFRWPELIVPAGLTGLLLGLGFWQFEARPRPTDE